MIDYRETPQGLVVDRVQLSDLEDSTHIPPGQALRGLQVGNQFWRSPEAHVQGAVGKPSDIFSLALVVSSPNPAYAFPPFPLHLLKRADSSYSCG